MELDLLVIGSGPSGQKAAVQAAKLGKRVAIAERRNRLGGVSIHTGTIPSKTLRQALFAAVLAFACLQSPPANAATPSSGTLSTSSVSVTYTDGGHRARSAG